MVALSDVPALMNPSFGATVPCGAQVRPMASSLLPAAPAPAVYRQPVITGPGYMPQLQAPVLAAQALPAQAFQAPAFPAQAVPAQAVPAQAVQAPAFPTLAATAQAAPAQAPRLNDCGLWV